MNDVLDALFRDLDARVAKEPLLAGLNLRSTALPSVNLVTKRSQVAIGASRVGGTPDVPPGFQWPRWRPPADAVDKFGQPMAAGGPLPLGFVAQIDLSEVPRISDTLPETGWLYFFYDRYCEPWGFDPADRGCCRIMYASCDRSELQRTEPPDDADPEHVAECCAVSARPFLSLPSEMESVEFETPTYDAVESLIDELGGPDYPAVSLLGHPQPVQSPMELQCQLVSSGVHCGDGVARYLKRADLAAAAAEWMVLLQVDSDEDGPGWMWGLSGMIYFWIRKQDLRSLRFDDVWVVSQSS
jgi:uncharacterized protein YwqG